MWTRRPAPGPEAEVRRVPRSGRGRIAVTGQTARDQVSHAGITEDGLGLVAAWRPEATARGPELADRFYAHILSIPETRRILEANTTIERQKPVLIGYFESLFAGVIDDAYLAARERVGQVHDRIGLGPLYYAAMYQFFTAVFTEALVEADAEAAELAEAVRAFNSIIMFDTALIVGAYADARQEKVEDAAREVERQMDIVDGQRHELLGMSEQLAAVSEQTLAATQEMGASAQSVAADAQAAQADAVAMDGQAESGRSDIEGLVGQVSRVAEEIGSVRAQVSDLTRNAEAIQSFVSVIRTIADQTNLLALNAAIEAARAGEAGRGFAVVASEVKALAESTGSSLESISQLVRETDQSVRAVQQALDGAETQVETSVRSGAAARGRFDEIVTSAAAFSHRVATIGHAVGELASTTQEIERSAALVADMATQTSELASR